MKARKSTTYISNTQNGNAIWFILLAVALFGILTATVTSNMSSVDQTGSKEQNRIDALALIRYGKEIENAVHRMLMNGISENELDFLEMHSSADNPNCNTDDCRVFTMAGGGITYRSPKTILRDNSLGIRWHVTDNNRVYGFGCDEQTRDCGDLLLLIQDVPTSICLEVNNIQRVDNPGGDAPQFNDILVDTMFTGAFTDTPNNYILGGNDATDEAPELRGKASGCFYEFSGGQDRYFFYQVLMAR